VKSLPTGDQDIVAGRDELGVAVNDQRKNRKSRRNCPFLNSFIPDAIGTVRVTPVTHLGTVNTKIIPIPTLNPGEKSFARRIELLNQDLAREYHEA
jgi:hypothetical protein